MIDKKAISRVKCTLAFSTRAIPLPGRTFYWQNQIILIFSLKWRSAKNQSNTNTNKSLYSGPPALKSPIFNLNFLLVSEWPHLPLQPLLQYSLLQFEKMVLLALIRNPSVKTILKNKQKICFNPEKYWETWQLVYGRHGAFQ